MNIDISIPEDEIKEVLTAYVAQKMPALNVKDIEFKVSRNPNTVSATVVADFGGTVKVVATVDTTTTVGKTVVETATVDTVQTEATVDTDTPVVDTEADGDDAAPKRKLFGKKTAETEED